MATELTVQSERAFQKQPHISLVTKSKTKRPGKGGVSGPSSRINCRGRGSNEVETGMLTRWNSAGGTRMLVWVSVPPRLPLRASTSVCAKLVTLYICLSVFGSLFGTVARRVWGYMKEEARAPALLRFKHWTRCWGCVLSKDVNYRSQGRLLTVFSTDKKCPFTGLVSIRGRILTGTVVSTKMHRTIIIRREYLHFIPKYSRYEKRHKNLAAHVSPAFRVEEGDQVTVGQCRPLSKTVGQYIRMCTRDVHGQEERLTMTYLGPVQRPPRAASHRQGRQEVLEVLKSGIERVGISSGISGVACLMVDLHKKWAADQGRTAKRTGSCLSAVRNQNTFGIPGAS